MHLNVELGHTLLVFGKISMEHRFFQISFSEAQEKRLEKSRPPLSFAKFCSWLTPTMGNLERSHCGNGWEEDGSHLLVHHIQTWKIVVKNSRIDVYLENLWRGERKKMSRWLCDPCKKGAGLSLSHWSDHCEFFHPLWTPVLCVYGESQSSRSWLPQKCFFPKATGLSLFCLKKFFFSSILIVRTEEAS